MANKMTEIVAVMATEWEADTTIRYREIDESDQVIGVIDLPKYIMRMMGNPQRIRVTVTVEA